MTALDKWRALAAQENARMLDALDGQGGFRPLAGMAAKEQAIEGRRDRVASMWAAGQRADEIAENLGVARNTVINDLIARQLWEPHRKCA